MWTMAAKALMLDALTTFYVGAFDDYPTEDGSANEITGGSPAYARQQINPSATSSGQRVSAETPSLDIPAGNLAWLGIWTAVSAGTCLIIHPNGGTRKRFLADPDTDVVTCPSHGYTNGDTIVFFGGGLAPTGLTKGTIYYVINATTNTFKVSATLGGSAQDLTTTGGAEIWVSRIVVLTYGSQGTYDLTGAVLDLNS